MTEVSERRSKVSLLFLVRLLSRLKSADRVSGIYGCPNWVLSHVTISRDVPVLRYSVSDNSNMHESLRTKILRIELLLCSERVRLADFTTSCRQ